MRDEVHESVRELVGSGVQVREQVRESDSSPRVRESSELVGQEFKSVNEGVSLSVKSSSQRVGV